MRPLHPRASQGANDHERRVTSDLRADFAREMPERARADRERTGRDRRARREVIAEQRRLLARLDREPLSNFVQRRATMLRASRLLTGIPEAELERLRPYLQDVALKRGEVLVEFDQPIPYVYFLDTAITSTVVRMPGGGLIEVGLMGAEGMVGLSLLFGVERSNATVIVQNPGTGRRMRAADFERHVRAQGGRLLDLLYRYSNFFNVMVQQHGACNAAHDVEARLCRWILLTHDRVGSDTLDLTQEFLSLMLGVRRPSVTHAARALKKDGLIDYTRGNLGIVDRARLERRACECYKVIRRQMERTFDPAV